MEPRGARDFSSPQVRVRGANDFRQYSNQRLRLPNERPPLGPRFRRTIGALLSLAIVGGIGVGVYFGVTLLLEEDDAPAAEVDEVVESVEADGSEEESATPVDSEDGQSADSGAAEQSATEFGTEQQQSADEESAGAEPDSAESAASGQQSSQVQQSSVAISSIEPTVSEQQVTPAPAGRRGDRGGARDGGTGTVGDSAFVGRWRVVRSD